MKQIERREFIKYTGGLVGLLLVGRFVRFPFSRQGTTKEVADGIIGQTPGQVADGSGTEADEYNRFGLVIDVGACIGCRRCQRACKEENNIPDTIAPPWIEVFEMKSGIGATGHPSPQDLKAGATTAYTKSPVEGRWYLPVQCNHCGNPPCIKVCPTGATYKDRDGLVLMDYGRCIGCRLCVVACPYSARRFNWFKPELAQGELNPLVPVRPLGVVEKCTFCVHRVRRGKLPRCVEVCPVQARHFGNLGDTKSEISKILEENMNFRLLEEQNTDPNLRYITRGKKWYEE